jgi:hypothetical protein
MRALGRAIDSPVGAERGAERISNALGISTAVENSRLACTRFALSLHRACLAPNDSGTYARDQGTKNRLVPFSDVIPEAGAAYVG